MIRRLVVAAAVLLSGAVFAQTDTGTVQIQGTVSPAISLYVGQSTFTTDTTGASITGTTPDTALAVVANFGDLSSTAAGGFQTLALDLHLRSNQDYQISAMVTDNVAAPGSVLPANEIGFAITGISYGDTTAGAALVGPRTGIVATLLDGTATSDDEVNQTFWQPAAWYVQDPATGRLPTYNSRLGQLATASPGTALVEGPQVSIGGSYQTPVNKLVISTEFAILPQVMMSAGTFDYTVTFTAVQL
jgi:hypothetical protein